MRLSRDAGEADAGAGRPTQARSAPDLTVNGDRYAVDVPVGRTLAETLRDDLGLTGTKVACGEGHCGACTVLLDGVPALSCITLVHTVGARDVTTIEGLREHPLVEAFVRADALQCGFCTPGQIVSASALVAAKPSPTRDEIRHGMAGNLCRCGTYPRIEEAIASVSESDVEQLRREQRSTRDLGPPANLDA
jgi:aerobic-type carbon monoxide dehydrogenase small subunit (CoxS/CutS family)